MIEWCVIWQYTTKTPCFLDFRNGKNYTCRSSLPREDYWGNNHKGAIPWKKISNVTETGKEAMVPFSFKLF